MTHPSFDERFLIIGRHGLIGQAVAQALAARNLFVQGTSCRRRTIQDLVCDILKPEDIERVFQDTHPTHVIHCANLAGGVKICEANPELAKQFHFEATAHIGQACLKHKAKLTFISSECVFDGKKIDYKEDDGYCPGNVYGQRKAESEKWIQEHLTDYVIIRTMSVFGWQPETTTPNALMSAYFAMSKRQKWEVSSYRWGTPTYVRDLARAIVHLSLSSHTGIFHAAGKTYLNRYDWLKKTFIRLGWDESWLVPQTKQTAHGLFYPAKIHLQTDKYAQLYNNELHTLEEALDLLNQDIEFSTQHAKVKNVSCA